MLSIRDQENRIHGQQAVAAAKALNTSNNIARGQAPKTPFKVPLNDENDRKGFAAGKSAIKAAAKGNENLQLRGKQASVTIKNSLKTPSVARAPLGQKTTNAKAKAYQAPDPIIEENDLKKVKQRSASARKRGPRLSHAEPERIDVLSDNDLTDKFDIGVIYPRPKNLSDAPDDLPEIDLSVLDGSFVTETTQDFYNQPWRDGLTPLQREQIRQAEESRKAEAIDEAIMKRSIDLYAPRPCTHMPLCPGDDCKDEPDRRRCIEEEYQQTLKSILTHQQKAAAPKKQSKTLQVNPRTKVAMPKSTVILPKTGQILAKNGNKSSGPSTALSRAAASKLSTRPTPSRTDFTNNKAVTGRQPNTNATQTSAATKNAVSGPSRHAVAMQVSRTTLGYAQGRVRAGEKRSSILPKQGAETFLPLPSSVEQIEHDQEVEHGMQKMLFEDGLDDFQMEMPEF